MHRISRRRTVGAGIALTALALGLSACGSSGGGASSGSGSNKVTTVNIAIPASAPEYALPAIAAGKHLFPNYVKVKWTILPGSEIIAPLSSGQDPLAVTASPEPEVAVSNTHNPITWLAQWGDPSDFQIIARHGINSLKQLAGKPIGVTTPDSATWFLARVGMKTAGIGPSGFTSVNLGTIGSIISAFSSGKVDGIVLSSTVGEGVVKSVPGSKVVYDFYTQKFPWSGSGLAGNSSWVKSHKQAVVGILEGLNKAEALLHKDPQSVVGPLASFVGSAPTSATVKTDLQQLVQKTPKTLQSTNANTESSVLGILRTDGGIQGASSSLASQMIDNGYLQQVAK